MIETRRSSRLCAAVLFAAALFFGPAAHAQQNTTTVNGAITITTGLTYQTLLPALATGTSRRSITIQNNNASDSCYLIFGSNIASQVTSGTTTTSTNLTIGGNTITAQKASILLQAGIPYQRYYPYVPSDALFVTCTTTGDSVYVDTQ
jgi:hypothetical protein